MPPGTLLAPVSFSRFGQAVANYPGADWGRQVPQRRQQMAEKPHRREPQPPPQQLFLQFPGKLLAQWASGELSTAWLIFLKLMRASKGPGEVSTWLRSSIGKNFTLPGGFSIICLNLKESCCLLQWTSGELATAWPVLLEPTGEGRFSGGRSMWQKSHLEGEEYREAGRVLKYT